MFPLPTLSACEVHLLHRITAQFDLDARCRRGAYDSGQVPTFDSRLLHLAARLLLPRGAREDCKPCICTAHLQVSTPCAEHGLEALRHGAFHPHRTDSVLPSFRFTRPRLLLWPLPSLLSALVQETLAWKQSRSPFQVFGQSYCRSWRPLSKNVFRSLEGLARKIDTTTSRVAEHAK